VVEVDEDVPVLFAATLVVEIEDDVQVVSPGVCELLPPVVPNVVPPYRKVLSKSEALVHPVGQVVSAYIYTFPFQDSCALVADSLP
jgi:hypothetical protein